MTPVTLAAIKNALATVNDPEIHRPITDLNMVGDIDISDDGHVAVEILLTTKACPLGDRISDDVRNALLKIPGVDSVEVALGAMTEAQRQELATKLRGGKPAKDIPFNQPGNLTRIYAVTSGKGGVGKSSVTVNLAAALASKGFKVGVVDADIYGFSIPRMLGIENPVQKVDEMLIPPVAYGVKVISIGMFVPANAPVIWRGPMLHRAVNQFLTDVFWGDIDYLLLDLPPGTGDVAISVAQLLPQSQMLVVTTPQIAAAEVAQRAGTLAMQTKQKVAGVIENMSYIAMPDGTHLPIFGAGGGETVAHDLTTLLGYEVPLLGQIPIEMAVREGSDAGAPVVLSAAVSPASEVMHSVATTIANTKLDLAGKSLGVQPK